MRIVLFGHRGYWGQKLARVALELGHTCVGIDQGDHFDGSEGEAAIIATPPDTHFPLAMKCMNLGMDVLVEKPMATSVEEAITMTDYALHHGLVLSVDSTFLHTAAADHLLELGGGLLSYQSIRVATTMPQAKINAAWDLIVHDLAILQRLSGVLVPGIGVVDGEVAQAALPLPTGGSAFIMASRAWTRKVREIILFYAHGTYEWTLDGLSMDGKCIVTETEEPLRRLVKDFVDRCLDRSMTGLTDGLHGTEVVGCLERLFSNNSSFQPGKGKMGNGLHRWGAVQHLPV